MRAAVSRFTNKTFRTVVTGIICFGVVLMVCACAPSFAQVTGIYTGAITDAADTSSEIWMQLFSDRSFTLREIRFSVPISTRLRTGSWNLQGNLVVLTIPGEKDLRYRWEHGFLRDESASAAHPGLPIDMVSLQRIGQ